MLRNALAGAVLASLAFTLPAQADEARPLRAISLAGHGEVRAAPDLAIISIGVTSLQDTAAAALAANSEAMKRVFATLTEAGIADKDIQTSNFMVQPRYDYSNNTQPPRLIGYDVTNLVNVTVRKLDSIGGVLDKVVSAGSNQVNGISFQLADAEAATDAARKLAVADAVRKAQLYTGASGVELGPILSISEGASFQPPMPMQAKAFRAEGASADVPVAQGEQVIAVDVSISWEIK
ncbi:MAG: DUF541 domain-containing protein [Alphaproteobacteria bacterium]|nr:DUF541 domain-containing protein [Alphaproteobacteria bacterium]